MANLITVDNIIKHFPVKGSRILREKQVVHALDNVSLTIEEGEVLGLVGESGCGKTTLGRCLLRLLDVTSGEIHYSSKNLGSLNNAELRNLRSQIQIVFQNPLASLNPRMRIQQVLEEPLRTHKIEKHKWDDIIVSSLEQVGLGRQHLSRYPHELSGGQCQRVAIARALSLNPKFLVLDEPTSALDVSVQAQIINLLIDLQKKRQLTYLFITHDLSVVEHLSDRIGVMYLGKLIEIGKTEDVFGNPQHPYTQALLASIPTMEAKRLEEPPLSGNVPSPISPPSGCRFHTRCPIAKDICKTEEPLLKNTSAGQQAACHLIED